MSEPNKKPIQISPESYKPETPTLMSMLEEAEKSIAQQTEVKSGMMAFTIENFGPYRFIGKSVYARAGKSGMIFGGLWEKSGWIFEELDAMKEYATEEIHNTALMHWDWYDGKDGREVNRLTFGGTYLLGYTVGRFMKASTPVPENMDYIDIPEMYVAKGWARGGDENDAEKIVVEGIERQGLYERASWIFMAEVYPKPDETGVSTCGYYIACQLKNPPQE